MPLSRRKFITKSALATAAGLTAPLLRTRLLAQEAPGNVTAAANTTVAAGPVATAAAEAAPVPVPAGWGVAAGPFQPTFASLAQYETPEWFRDAKFGIWAHWGPQCVPEQGDWYARRMYISADPKTGKPDADYTYQCAHYGHPSKFGFKDIDNLWHAEDWDPQKLIGLYQRAGAKYFTALANHHDNLDCFDSTYQEWNVMRVGPKKDIVGGWEKVARAAGLRFGVTVHAAHAWTWYEPAQGADKTGPLAGVPYDGKLTKADGKGLWWEGLDPQELYAQNHALSKSADISKMWAWGNGASIPDKAYCEKFFNRTIDLINKYNPDLLYFDDTVLPLYPISDAGLRIAAYYYNHNMAQHGGKLEAVLNGKVLDEQQRKCMVWDVERGVTDNIEPQPWQTDTCIGEWHYRLSLFERHRYKNADTVAHMLVDIVSKNGNLLLNIPLPPGGAPDADELKFLADFTAWMDLNNEGIFGTRPWKVFGEGPAATGAAPIKAQGFNEGKNKPYTAQDWRFTQKGDTLYGYMMAWPDSGPLVVKSLAEGSPLAPGTVTRVESLGAPGPLQFTRDANGLSITPPATKPGNYVYGFKFSGTGLTQA
jgi:alpha-L-fucosidase